MEARPPVAGVGASAGKAGSIRLGTVPLKDRYGAAWGGQGVLPLVASVPTLIEFLFLQCYFVKGMTMGAVNG